MRARVKEEEEVRISNPHGQIASAISMENGCRSTGLLDSRTLLDLSKSARGLLAFRSTKQPWPAPQQQQQKQPHTFTTKEESNGDCTSSRQTTSNKPYKKKSAEHMLPERLQLLEEFYDAMEAGISLLRIRHQVCSFSAISAAIESSTQRRFLRSHLAQMKYLLPEGIHVEEHISWNADMQASRKDLRIILYPITVEGGELQACRSKSPRKTTEMVARRKEFHRRLIEFAIANPKIDCEVPQAEISDRPSTAARNEAMHQSMKDDRVSVATSSVSQCEAASEMNNNPSSEQGDAAEDNNPQEDVGASLSLPLEVAFHPCQLKKFPRSDPGTLTQEHQCSSAPQSSTRTSASSHLPSIFKRHFSKPRGRPSILSGLEARAANGEPTLPSVSSVVGRGGHETSYTNEMTRAAASRSPCCPSTAPPLPSQKKMMKKASQQDAVASVIMSPPRQHINTACQTTSARTPCSILSNPFLSPPPSSRSGSSLSATPSRDICTPSAPPCLPSMSDVLAPKQEAPDAPPVHVARRRAAVKSLRFGSPPSKRSTLILQDASHSSSDDIPGTVAEPIPPASAPSPRSPSSSSPAKVAYFVTPKKAHSSLINRALAFPSPARFGPSSDEATTAEVLLHTPKRKRLSSLLASDLHSDSAVPSKSDQVQHAGLHSSTMPNEHSSNPAVIRAHPPSTSASKLSASDAEILKCLPQELLDDVQAKERKSIYEAASGLEKAQRRQQLISGLPQLFNMVRLIFQSGNRTVLTRKDLIRMVVASHPDITDQGEVREQLQLLVDLAPEWMSTCSSSTGEQLYRINKNANMRAVSKSLTKAKHGLK